VRVKEVRGRETVDVWRYETRNGGRTQVFEYVGPLRDPKTETVVEGLLRKYRAQAMEEFPRRAIRVGRAASLA
jgi:hypothetical protein